MNPNLLTGKSSHDFIKVDSQKESKKEIILVINEGDTQRSKFYQNTTKEKFDQKKEKETLN